MALNLKPRPNPTSQPAPRDRQRLIFALLCSTLALEAVGAGMLYPLLARIQAAHHLHTSALGFMSGAYFVAALVAQLVGGRLLDGSRARPVLLGGLALGSASLVWFGLAGSLWGLVGARAVGGLCYGIVGPAALRAGTVGVPTAERGARLGRLSSAQMSGIILGPFVGSVLAGIGGLAFPFLFLAVALGVTFLALLLIRPAPAAVPAGASGGPAGSARSAVTPQAGPALTPARASTLASTSDPAPASTLASTSDPAPASTLASPRSASAATGGRPSLNPATRVVLALVFLAVGAQLANGLYDALWSRLLTDRGAGSLLIGLSLSLYGIPFALIAPAGGRLASRRGPLKVAGLGLLVASCLLASYGFVTVPLIILILGVTEGFAQALAVPGGYSAVANVYPDERAATGQGLFGAAGTAASGGAALLGAPVYAAWGAGAAFGGGAIISAACVVAAMILGRGRMGAPPTGGAGGAGGAGHETVAVASP